MELDPLTALSALASFGKLPPYSTDDAFRILHALHVNAHLRSAEGVRSPGLAPRNRRDPCGLFGGHPFPQDLIFYPQQTDALELLGGNADAILLVNPRRKTDEANADHPLRVPKEGLQARHHGR